MKIIFRISPPKLEYPNYSEGLGEEEGGNCQVSGVGKVVIAQY